jgi:hypothetical protein
MNPRLSSVQYEHPYKLLLTFTNREVKEFDFSSYLQYPVYEVLEDEALCSKARVLNGTVVWDNDVDFDPDTLYLDSKTHVS